MGVWESRTCVNAGESTISVWEEGAFLATFRRGEVALSVVRVVLFSFDSGVSCLRFETTSEKDRTGDGGVFHSGEGHPEKDLRGEDLEDTTMGVVVELLDG